MKNILIAIGVNILVYSMRWFTSFESTVLFCLIVLVTYSIFILLGIKKKEDGFRKV